MAPGKRAEPPDPALGAMLLRDIGTAVLAAELPDAAASFAELAIAPSLEARGSTGAAILDPEGTWDFSPRT